MNKQTVTSTNSRRINSTVTGNFDRDTRMKIDMKPEDALRVMVRSKKKSKK